MVAPIDIKSPDKPGQHLSTDFLAGGGEMGERIRAFDWSNTPLGPIDQWPQSLTTSVSTSLGCAFPIILWWGPELTVLYNDEYRPIFGAKHPGALGQPGARAWASIWDVIGPMLSQVLERGEATRSRDLLLHIDRHGYPEEAYFSFSYSPIQAENSRTGGVFCPVIETTDKVIGERRLRTLRDLAAACQGAESEQAVFQSAASVLAANAQDVPFAIIYRIDESQHLAQLGSVAGIAPGNTAAPLSVPLQPEVPETRQWLCSVVETGKPVVVTDLATRYDQLPTGAWKVPANSCIALPILLPGQVHPSAVLAAAVSPMRPLDADYRTFFELLATQIASGLADAKALEVERRRAEALAEIDRAKTTFFSNVSHEFRTPLTLMLGPLEDLKQQLGRSSSPLSGQYQQLELMHRNGLRLLKLVNSLLDFSRIEAGRVQGCYEPTDLSAYTAELASVFRSATDKAGLKLIVDCPPLSEPAFVDREMWEKIVLNLVSNAFKFTFDGEIELKLRNTGEHFVLAVRDSGTGIPVDEVPKLFERFHRVAGAQGRTHEGSGIGLALVQELARLHGGSVSVESVYGKGSTFTVAIPLGRSHLPAHQIGATRTQVATAVGARPFIEEALRWIPDAGPDVAHSMEDRATAQQVDRHEGKQPRILLADDNADMRDYVRRLLASRYEVEVVADGGAALSAIARRKPDLVLSDIMMPRLDGMELVLRLRADPQTNTLPIILLSARAGEESRVEGMQAGADDYLIKPFSARELLARVDAHVKIARFRRDAEQALRDEQERWQLAAHVARFGQWHLDLVTHAVDLSASCKAIFGLPPEEQASAERLFSLIHADDREAVATRLKEAVETRTAYEVEYRVIWPDGSLHWNNTRGSASYAPDGTALKMVGVTLDITERKRGEEHLRTLNAELDHRVKNVLATVSAIITQTTKARISMADFVAGLGGRIKSLARTHELLSHNQWQDVSLVEIVQREIEPYAAGNASVLGPAVMLKAAAAQALATVLHELATNAAKYGAFSRSSGRLFVGWCWLENGSHGRVAIQWQESGGPAVSIPSQTGFGTSVIRELIPFELGGTVDLTFASDGLQCRLEIPADWLSSDAPIGDALRGFDLEQTVYPN